MRIIQNAIDYLLKLSGIVAAIAVMAIMVHVTLDVIGKYLFNMPVPATLTFVADYYMLLIAFLPLAFVERMDDHIGVEVLTGSFSPRVQHHLYNWTLLLSAAAAFLLCYATFLESMAAYDIGAFEIELETKIIIWPAYFAGPVGFGLYGLVLVFKFVAYLTNTVLDEFMPRDESEFEVSRQVQGD